MPDSRLRTGARVPLPGTPLTLRVKRFYANAQLAPLGPGGPPALADRGVGAGITRHRSAAGHLGPGSERHLRPSWSPWPAAAATAPGWCPRCWARPSPSSTKAAPTPWPCGARRYYLPYSLTLKKFSHDVYPGTQIPKNFSSLVHLSNPARGEERDVLIYMNQPLRYAGKTFYQASYGKGDTLSILQVVTNPGWLLPYISCSLITLGLLFHFCLTLFRALQRRQAGAEAEAV